MDSEIEKKKLSDLLNLYKSGFITKDEYNKLTKEIQGSQVGSSKVPLDINPDQVSILVQRSIFEEKIRTDESNINLLFEFAKFLIANHMVDDAKYIITKLKKIDENSIELKKVSFELYLSEEKFDKAKLLGDEIACIAPNDIDFLERLVYLSKKSKDWVNTISYCDKALRINENNKVFIKEKGFALLKLNSIELASENLHKLYADGVEERLVILYAGVWKSICGDFSEAISLLQKIVKVQENQLEDTNTNRGILYFLYSKIENGDYTPELLEVFNKINFKFLTKNSNITDEKVAIRVLCFIVKEGLKTNISKGQYNDWLKNIPNLKYYKENFENAARLWLEIGKKHFSLKSYTESIISFQRAKNYSKENSELIFYLKEAEDKLRVHHKQRRILIASVSSLAVILIISMAYFQLKGFREKKLYESVVERNHFDAYVEYLKKYPKGKYREEVLDLSDNAFWESTRTYNTIDAYQKYLEIFPKGSHIDEANQGIEEILWIELKSVGTAESFNKYLSEYPEGIYKSQALTSLRNINSLTSFDEDDAKRLILEDISSYSEWGESDCFESKEKPVEHVISDFRRIILNDEVINVAIVYSTPEESMRMCAVLSMYEFRNKYDSWQVHRKYNVFKTTRAVEYEYEPIPFELKKISSSNYAISIETHTAYGVSQIETSLGFYIPSTNSMINALELEIFNEERDFDNNVISGFSSEVVINEKGSTYFPIEIVYTEINGKKRREVYEFRGNQYLKQ